MLQIPTDSSGLVPAYSETIQLDGSLYLLRFVWNTRTEHWYLSVYLPDETPITLGRMVINGVNLLRSCSTPGRPPGIIIAVPIDTSNEHAGLDGLGSRVGLYYVPITEVGAEP